MKWTISANVVIIPEAMSCFGFAVHKQWAREVLSWDATPLCDGLFGAFISVSNLSQERLLLPCCFSMTAKALPATPCEKMLHDCLMSWEKRDHHRILSDCCRRTRPTECYSNWEEALVQWFHYPSYLMVLFSYSEICFILTFSLTGTKKKPYLSLS